LKKNTLTANNPPFPGFPFHSPNTTNIHTHGLHVSSVVSKDDFKLDNTLYIYLRIILQLFKFLGCSWTFRM